MAKLSVSVLGWAGTEDAVLFRCLDSLFSQSYSDFEVVYTDNASGRLVPIVRERYGQHLISGAHALAAVTPQFRIVEHSQNLGYAHANNIFFAEARTELVMVLNPDAVLDPDYLKNIVPVFDNPRIAAAAGKMIRPKTEPPVLDGTGIVMDITRRGRERGQLEEDRGQYDSANQRDVFGVSGSAALYRKSALDAAALALEYFDTDFYMYWEDVDLAWRLRLAGFSAQYVPEAVVFHGRTAGRSKGGYKKVFTYIKHHSALPLSIRRWNWRNHLFMIIKNDFGLNFWKGLPFIILRELAMFGYICFVEPRTLGALPGFFRLLPKMLVKRKLIQMRRRVTSKEISKWFGAQRAQRGPT